MSDETILITGGTGFIGAYTAAHAIDRGNTAVAFDINDDTTILEKVGIDESVEVITGDITDPTDVFDAVHQSGATRIIHLASLLTDLSNEHPRHAIDVNIKGTNTVFEAAKTFDDQIDRVAWASSSAVYAPPDRYADPEVDEEDLVYPETLYGAAKEYNEHQATIYRENYSVSLIGLRPTLVYGPYRQSGSASAYTRVIEGPALNEPVSVGPKDHVFDWQHVADAAQAFYLGAMRPESDLSRTVYNVCGERATVAEIADIVLEYLPDADISLQAGDPAPWNHHMDMSAAKADLGYDPEYDLRSGIVSYINSVRNEHGFETVS
ncbi:Nucleoside-diphosphate-sugar epimerase [Halanaeroarchaeum sp. HSR-CO]|uniref:NAD-dependent epimerase/dehydratase family protein n=1 Tax=Halanaeroarchaeum sp. HSR-CO TaxID=2866382 RepID=UPI00217E7315|nr:NAD(P)-dependent oxidoreductase [Halanaeroarchaeum sp. HSR-CO]UWG47089.1 Nucleoside-diphosphate-sugar epimerase [Halanaeroarchaeum sp. HSR-CO]